MPADQSTSPPTRALPHPPWWRQPGLLRRIFADPQPVLDEVRAAHGPVVGLGAGPVRMAIVGDPTALRELFATSTDAFRWGHKFNVLGFVVAERTMRETTRLHPAGVISPREAARDVVVGGYRIPAGTLILWSAYLAGRDQAAWDEPLQFDPDRFTAPSPEREELAHMAWVPFGRGARNCIGFALALAQMELTIIVARLAQRLEIEPSGAPLPKAVGMVVNRPAGGAVLRVSARRV